MLQYGKNLGLSRPAELPMNPPQATPSRAAWYALVVLGLVYLFNFLDRTLIFILFAPIKKEMTFSDIELSLLGSTSFVLFYTLLGMPFGRLADRVNRPRLIAAGLALWSLFSGLTGLAEGFASIFFCRMMVGVGEATLGAAAMSLLAELFPARMRATVQSIFSAGIPLGAAAAMFLGGQFGAAYGWRNAFFLLSFPGLLLVAAVLLIRDPRGAPKPAAGQSAATQQSSPLADLGIMARIPALRWHLLGYAAMAVAGNSIGMWLPTLVTRVHAMPLQEVGNFSGLAMLVSGGLATLFGGAVADAVVRRGGTRLAYGAVLATLCVPLWLGLLLSGSLPILQACWFLLAGLGLAWLGPAAADVQDLVPERLRGFSVSVYFFAVNIIGYGAAPPLIGWLSDRLGSAEQPEKLALALLVSPAACAFAALALARGAMLKRAADRAAAAATTAA
jgi:MFS family permease